MSENEDYEENLTDAQKEAIKKLRTRIPVENAKELIISAEVNPDMLKKSAWFDEQAQRLSKELSDLGQQTDSTEINPSNLKEKIGELQDLKKMRRQAEQNADPTNKPSSGTLSLEGQGQGGCGTDEWDSVESMINDIQRIKRTGTSQQKKRAQEVLNAMLLKSLKGSKQKAELEGKFVKNYEDKDKEGVIEKLNREYRERRKLKKDVEK